MPSVHVLRKNVCIDATNRLVQRRPRPVIFINSDYFSPQSSSDRSVHVVGKNSEVSVASSGSQASLGKPDYTKVGGVGKEENSC